MKNFFYKINSILLKEFDFEKNKSSDIKLSYGSDKKIWWKCKNGHSWSARIANRSILNRGCPYCSNHLVSYESSLGSKYPLVAKEFSEKNKISIFTIAPKTNRKYIWKCKLGHEWLTSPNSRTGHNSGCPICFRITLKFRRLSVKHKETLRLANIGIHRKPIKENFFKKLNNESAYVYGYLLADGCLSKRKHRNGYRISFTTIDKELLDKIVSRLEAEQYKIRKSKTIIRNIAYTFQTSNPIITKDLIKYGFIERKANRLVIPKEVTNELFWHFLRGFFDGDGCFYVVNSFDRKYNYLKGSFSLCSLSKDFLISIQDTLKQYSIFSRIKKHSSQETYSLIVARFDDLKHLYSFLYKNSDNLYLSRKKNKFEYYLKNKKRGKISGNFTQEVRKKIALALKNKYSNDVVFRTRMLDTNRRNGRLRKSLPSEKYLSLFKKKDEIAIRYRELKSLKKVAVEFSVCKRLIAKVLDANNIEREKHYFKSNAEKESPNGILQN